MTKNKLGIKFKKNFSNKIEIKKDYIPSPSKKLQQWPEYVR